MLIHLLYIILGIFFLVWSADKFIEGASATATHLGMSPLLVGILIIGFGTSAPEMFISAIAAYHHSPGIALGNAYGSNITNIALMLGITVVFYPLIVNSRIIKREIPILIIVQLVSLGFFLDYQLSKIEALILLILLFCIMGYSLFYKGDHDSIEKDFEKESNQFKQVSLSSGVLKLVIGLAILLISSDFLVKGSIYIARSAGISELVIGLTIVAIGTSLPELAASIVAAKKGEHDMVLGNIIGSCIFNILGVTGIAAVIQPITIEPIFLLRDFSAAFFLTILLLIFTFGLKKKSVISKGEGITLVICYISYSAILYITSVHH